MWSQGDILNVVQHSFAGYSRRGFWSYFGNRHPHTVARSEGNAGLGSYGMIGNQSQLKSLRDHRQEQGRFHHRERSPDAEAGSAPKGKVRETRKLLGRLVSPAIGIELLGMVEETGIAVHDPWAHDHVCTHRKPVAGNLCFFPDADRK